jgi:murein L,D-transpeptidase YcbB/YkuD
LVFKDLCAAVLACGLAGAAVNAVALPWFDGGRPTAAARQAVELLETSASDGLDPQDYRADAWRAALLQAELGPPPDAAGSARLEQALDLAMQRYLGDLHGGRIDPQQIHHDFKPPRRGEFDPAVYLQAALAAQRLPEAAREAAPALALYRELREQLARYRRLADHAAWQQALPPLPPATPAARRSAAPKLTPEQPYAGATQLAQRLTALGDLAPQAWAPSAPSRYDGALVEAVRAFQQRHGLSDDGVIGAATLAQLQVTPTARVRQIELTLERLRWTPLMQGTRMITINIPEFVLRAYEVQDGRIHVRQEMKVIVGKALDTRTPLFDEDMRHIEFSPYWNVPPSIERAELVPRLRREPGYFVGEGFEFVAADGRVETALSPARLDAVLAGQMRIRQRPGPRNALGDIKFVFPNRDNIYLHHTPATQLFAQARRDFSHGCIRVEHPLALASFVLQPMPEWTEERIRQAMEKGVSTTLKLTEPVPVLIAYGTTLVKAGRIYFYDDLYGLDRLLDTALQRRVRPAPALP